MNYNQVDLQWECHMTLITLLFKQTISTSMKTIHKFIQHWFYLSSQISLTDKFFWLYTVTDQNIAFLVPDSC